MAGATKSVNVQVKFVSDYSLVKRAQNEIRRENRVTQDQIRNDQNKTIKNLFDQTNKIKGHFSNLSNRTLGVLGLGFGLHGLVSSAGQFIGQIGRVGDELTGLSDQFGSVNKAVNIYYSGLGSSFASMGQVKSAMMELGNEGLKLDDNFKTLTFAIADFSQITGISSSSMANLAGAVKGFGLANAKDMRELMNSVVSIGLNGQQAAAVVQSIGKAVENLGYYAKDGGKSVKALGQGISESTAFLTKMGIRAHTATSFMDKLTDPEQYEEMAGLLNRINISQADYFNMLRTEEGKKNFFTKLQENLPAIADQIMAINNPIAQRNFAKSLGLPMEIAAKLAGKTRSEIQDIVQKSMTDKKAIEKKESQAKANQERFTETLEMFKMNALMPLMQFMVRNIPNFMKFASLISDFVRRALGTATSYMDKFQGTVDKVFKDSNTLGDLLTNAIGPIFEIFVTMLLDTLKGWFKLPWWGMLLTGFVAFKKIAGFASGIVTGFARGTRMNPQIVRDADSMKSGADIDSGKKGGRRGLRGRGGRLSRIASGIGKSKIGSSIGKAAVGVGKFGARIGARLLPGIGAVMAIGGAAMDFANAKTSKEKKEAVAGGIGALAGGIAGAKLGALIGTAIAPGIGTAIGGALGGVVGAIAGGPIVKAIAGIENKWKALGAVLSFFVSGPIGPIILYWKEINNGLGRLIGTQALFKDGLNDEEVKRHGYLTTLSKSTKLTKEQQAELDKLNSKMQTTNVNLADNIGAALGKLISIFTGSNATKLGAKLTLGIENFKTMFISAFNDLGAMLTNPVAYAKTLIGGEAQTTKKSIQKLYEDAINESNPQKLKQIQQQILKFSTSDNAYIRDFAGTKAQALAMRAEDTQKYLDRVRKEEIREKAEEDAKRHQEQMKALGGIGGGINKVAENTAPEKNPVREAFKELALTNTQIMETQFAGSNFTSK